MTSPPKVSASILFLVTFATATMILVNEALAPDWFMAVVTAFTAFVSGVYFSEWLHEVATRKMKD